MRGGGLRSESHFAISQMVKCALKVECYFVSNIKKKVSIEMRQGSNCYMFTYKRTESMVRFTGF